MAIPKMGTDRFKIHPPNFTLKDIQQTLNRILNLVQILATGPRPDAVQAAQWMELVFRYGGEKELFDIYFQGKLPTYEISQFLSLCNPLVFHGECQRRFAQSKA